MTTAGKKIITILLLIMCITCLAMSFSTFVYAEEALDEAGEQIKTGVTNGMDSAYKIIMAVAGPIGAIAMVVCGIKMLWGSAKAAEEAKGALIRIVIAMAIIFLGPLIVKSIRNWFTTGNENMSMTIFDS